MNNCRNICAGKAMPAFLQFASCFLLLTVYCILFSVLVSCGRRGDPVPIALPDNEIVRGAVLNITDKEKSGISEEADQMKGPGIPTGITALFTGKIVVLSWDDSTDRQIKFYRIYRSSGEGFVQVGETEASAFTDSDVELNTEYRYRVTAVGQTESGPSAEIRISTQTE